LTLNPVRHGHFPAPTSAAFSLLLLTPIFTLAAAVLPPKWSKRTLQLSSRSGPALDGSFRRIPKVGTPPPPHPCAAPHPEAFSPSSPFSPHLERVFFGCFSGCVKGSPVRLITGSLPGSRTPAPSSQRLRSCNASRCSTEYPHMAQVFLFNANASLEGFFSFPFGIPRRFAPSRLFP